MRISDWSSDVCSSDLRGLCGGLNVNAFRATIRSIREWQAKGVEADLVLIGNKAVGFFKRMGGKVLATTSQLGDKPQVEQLIGVIKVLADAYRDGSVDRVYVVGNKIGRASCRERVCQYV